MFLFRRQGNGVSKLIGMELERVISIFEISVIDCRITY